MDARREESIWQAIFTVSHEASAGFCSDSCQMPAAGPQSEQQSAASELAVAASVEAMSIDDEAVAESGTDSTRAPVPAGEALQSIDENAGARGIPVALRISARMSGESAPCIPTHPSSPCLARASTAGGEQDEAHAAAQWEQPPAEVPLEELTRRAQIKFSGMTGAVVASGDDAATTAPSYGLLKDGWAVIEALPPAPLQDLIKQAVRARASIMFSGKTGAPVPSGIKSDAATAEKPAYGLARAAIEVVFNAIATLTQTGVRPPVSLEGVGVRLPVGSPRGLPLHSRRVGRCAVAATPRTWNPIVSFPAPPASPLNPSLYALCARRCRCAARDHDRRLHERDALPLRSCRSRHPRRHQPLRRPPRLPPPGAPHARPAPIGM